MLKIKNVAIVTILAILMLFANTSCQYEDSATGDVSGKVTVQEGRPVPSVDTETCYIVIYEGDVLTIIPESDFSYYEEVYGLVENTDYTIDESAKTITLTFSGHKKVMSGRQSVVYSESSDVE